MELERDLSGKEKAGKDRILEARKERCLGVVVSSSKASQEVKGENWNQL